MSDSSPSNNGSQSWQTKFAVLVPKAMRKRIPPYELAHIFKEMTTAGNMVPEEIAQVCERAVTGVIYYLKFAELPSKIKDFVRQGIVSINMVNHALRLADNDADTAIIRLRAAIADAKVEGKRPMPKHLVSSRKIKPVTKKKTETETPQPAVNMRRDLLIKLIQEQKMIIRNFGTQITELRQKRDAATSELHMFEKALRQTES